MTRHPHRAPPPPPTGWPRGLAAWSRAGLLLLTSACAAAPQAPAPDAPATEAGLLARIEAEIGPAACTADAHCRTLPIGAKACGGPERWMAWSAAGGQGERLRLLSDKLSALAQQRHAQLGMVSNCAVVPDPGAVCREGRCVLAAGGGRGLNLR